MKLIILAVIIVWIVSILGCYNIAYWHGRWDELHKQKDSK